MDGCNQIHKPRSTRHRRDVLEAVRLHGSPMSADALYLVLQAAGSDISLSTVYRVLEHLTTVGEILRTVPMDGSKALYETANAGHEHNMICLGCHGIVRLTGGCPFSELEHRVAGETGFTVESHRLELYGYCRACNEKGVHPE